jgi:hypothetical protein
MMQWSEISLTPSNRTLRQFAGLWLLFLGGLACWHGFVHHHAGVALAFAFGALAIGPLGLLRPQAIRLVFIACTILTFPIGWAVSRILLALMFYGIFTPVGLLFRFMGRDVLQRTLRPDQATYWQPKAAVSDLRGYLRQF